MANSGAQGNRGGNGESTQGYFRKIFEENPTLLDTRSNEELLTRWLADHPGQREVPKTVKNGLQNVKGVLRSRGRKRSAASAARLARSAPPASGSAAAKVPTKPASKKIGLEALEEQIDECLILARTMDREKLESIIHHLRRARNEVVWMMG